MKRRYLLYILFFIFIAGVGHAQVQFNAKVSKKRLGINERLRIDFEMNQDGDNFSPPNFKGFRVVGGPNQAISNSYINGKRSYSKTYSYFLSPLSQGNFTIGQATIDISGQIYKTLPVKVTVTSAVTIPKDGNDVDYIASENVHLIAEISNTNPYLNEAITVTYKLYVSNEVSIRSQWREIDIPKYADFWSQNMDNRGEPKIYEGKYKGEDYRFVVLRTTVLYPQKTGKLDIEPLTLDIPIDVQSNKRDIFGRRVMSRVNKTISAGSRTIDVKPLPLEGRPDNFLGAVGNFQFDVTSNKTKLDANESLELSVAVRGNGNLKLFKLPSLKLPSTLEVYEPEHGENVQTKKDGMRGTVSDTYTVVPQYKGNFPVRPMNFSFFDPKEETYKSLSSKEIVIEVENGPLTSQANNDNTSGDNKSVVNPDADQFKYIKLSANLEMIEQDQFFKSNLFWALLGGPFLLIPLFIIAGKQRRKRLDDIDGNRVRKANKLARKYLSTAKKNMKDKMTFYDALESALHNYLKSKLHIETSEFSKERISQLLQKHEVNSNTIDEFDMLLKSCEFARYTPTSNVTINSDYKKAVMVISDIDKQMR